MNNPYEYYFVLLDHEDALSDADKQELYFLDDKYLRSDDRWNYWDDNCINVSMHLCKKYGLAD